MIKDLNYRIGEPLAGAIRLDLRMRVETDTELHDETGFGRVTQSVNPPLNMDTRVYGSYDKLENFIVSYFTGEPAPGVGINLEGALVVPEWGKPGQASFWFIDPNTRRRQHVGPVPAMPIKETAQ